MTLGLPQSMVLDLPKLRIFVAVARNGSFTRAADALDLRQPTVSQQIQVLEQGLRTRLFDRRGRATVLTPGGVALLSYAERILTLAEEAQAATREAAGLATRTLRLGAGNTLATYILPDLLARLQWERPDVLVQITVGNTDQLLDAVLDGRVELALVGSPIDDHRLSIHPFIHDKLVVIVPPDELWKTRQSLAFADLRDQTLLMREAGSALQVSVVALLRQHDVEPAHTITLGNLEAIKRSVEVGLGVAIVPAIAVRREVQSGALLTLELHEVHDERSFNYVYRRGQALSPAARVFAALVAKPFE
jgi:DNA-binding transcriptional LysR family regulator